MIFETETAIYTLTDKMLWRSPREAPVVSEEYPHPIPAAVASLRMDGDPIPYRLLAPIVLGEPAFFELTIRPDGTPTIRHTTNVICIR